MYPINIYNKKHYSSPTQDRNALILSLPGPFGGYWSMPTIYNIEYISCYVCNLFFFIHQLEEHARGNLQRDKEMHRYTDFSSSENPILFYINSSTSCSWKLQQNLISCNPACWLPILFNWNGKWKRGYEMLHNTE